MSSVPAPTLIASPLAGGPPFAAVSPVYETSPVGGPPQPFDNEGIRDQCIELGPARRSSSAPGAIAGRRVEVHLRVRERRACCLDRRLTGPPIARVGEDPVLGREQADDGRGGDRDGEDGEHQGLPAVVAHGVHSITRAASPLTTSAGRPANESGAASA